jgi:hypothetical protein
MRASIERALWRSLRAAGLALAVLATASCSLSRKPSPEKSEKRAEAMWTRVGEELAAAAAGQIASGGRVLVVRASAATAWAPVQDVIELSLKAKLPAGTDIKVETVPDAPRPAGVGEDYPVTPQPIGSAWLASTLKEDSPVSLVVSLVGRPAGAPAPGQKPPPIVCFDPEGGDELAAMIRSGRVAAAVTLRRGGTPPESADWFERRYSVVTPANVDPWAAGTL